MAGKYVYEVVRDCWISSICRRFWAGDTVTLDQPIKSKHLKQVSGPGLTEKPERPDKPDPIVLNSKK